jgi:hypothetical protein
MPLCGSRTSPFCLFEVHRVKVVRHIHEVKAVEKFAVGECAMCHSGNGKTTRISPLTLGEQRGKMWTEVKMADESENRQYPEWIARRQREKREQERRDEEALQRRIEASGRVANEGLSFWDKLVARLKVNVEALPALGDELVGSASLPDRNATRSPELHCHVEVNRQSVPHGPELSQMNLWYRPGGSVIRRWYQNQERSDIALQSGLNGIVAVIDSEAPKTAEELADHIVQWMADRVRYVARRRFA